MTTELITRQNLIDAKNLNTHIAEVISGETSSGTSLTQSINPITAAAVKTFPAIIATGEQDFRTAISGISPSFLATYNSNPTITAYNQFVTYVRGAVTERYYLRSTINTPYTINSTVTPDPLNDNNLRPSDEVSEQFVENYIRDNAIYTFNSVADMQATSIIPTEGAVFRTNSYNADVICNWTITQTVEAHEISVTLTNHAGWHAVLIPNLGSYLTPEMAGAYGDLSQEDHGAVQACLNYFEGEGRPGVVLVNGNYLVGDTIRGVNYSSMEGVGEFKAKDGLNKTVIDIYAQDGVRRLDNVSYKYFTVDGNKANQAATTDELVGAGFALRCDQINPFTNPDTTNHYGEMKNIVVDGVKCNNCKRNGLYFGRNTFVEQGYNFNMVGGDDNDNSGIFLDDFCEYISFSNVECFNNPYGVYDNGSSNISFNGGVLNNNTQAGIYVHTTGRNSSKKIISNLHLNHNLRGVWVGSGMGSVGEPNSQIIICNNHILASDRQGVVASAGIDCRVCDNVFSGNGGSVADTYDDIFLSISCKRWAVNNIHISGTNTRHAIYYENPLPSGIAGHSMHRIDGTFEGYDNPIQYLAAGNPTTTPLNANTNIVQGVFEYWNSPATAPSKTASNTNANVNTDLIPAGTICVNNGTADGSERWIAERPTSSSGNPYVVTFRRVANFS